MSISRKRFLQTGALTVAGAALAVPSGAATPIVSPNRKRVLRVAHLTDVHVQPQAPAPHGFAAALHAAQSLADKPDIIFNTGDCIMDSMSKHKDEVRKQWDVWQLTLKNENSLNIAHCIGNHDVWGITMPHATIKSDKHYGKQWAVEELGIKNRYYSFDKNGWHFIVLDSTHPVAGFGYTALLDDEQFEWLKTDISMVPATTFIAVLSHIPILGVSVFFDGAKVKEHNWQVSGADMHRDAHKLKDLFHQHKNVKLCLSGHIHLIDQLEYLGVKYLCNGAVSGAWWGGDNQEFPPAFATIDLYDDGSSENEIHYYNWKG
jgi:predicted MPP superfamily phosphohydrolase